MHSAGNEHFLVPCPQYLLSANAMIGRVNTGLGPEVKFPLTVCCEVSLLTEPPSLRKHPFLLALRRGGRFALNVPGGEEQGETDVFAGYEPPRSREI